MDNYSDYEEEREEKDTYRDSHRFRFGKLLKKIFKALAILIVIAVYGIIFARLHFAKVPADFKKVVWTENMASTYNADPEGFELLSQNPAAEQDDSGFYQISDIAYSKAAGEIQFTIRYNSRSTINTLMEKYNLGERPAGEIFVYILRDDSGKVYTNYEFAAASRPMNEFRRLIFDGVDFVSAGNLYLDIYYGGDVSAKAPMNVSFTAYSRERTAFPINHKGPSEPKLKFSENPAYISSLD